MDPKEEREAIKQKADLLGVEYKNNTPTEKIRELVNEKIKSSEAAKSDESKVEEVKRMSKEEEHNLKVQAQRREGMKLRRVIITCNDPDMKDYTTTPYMSISNRYITYPTVTAPLNVEWHVPQVYYDFLKAQEMKIAVNGKDAKGRKITTRKTIKRYNIQDLPDLTTKEIKELAAAQLARDGVAKAE